MRGGHLIGLFHRARVGLAIVGSGACAVVLLVRVGQPLHAVAGLLLALMLPGWIATEAVHRIRPMSAAEWVMHVLGLSICVTILIAAVLAAVGRLDGPELGSAWMIATGLLGVAAGVETEIHRHAGRDGSAGSVPTT